MEASKEETRPCVLCDRRLEPACPTWSMSEYQPYYGGEMQLLFGYGSTKFDKGMYGTRYQGLVCDDCAEKLVGKMKETIYHDGR